MSWQAVSWVLQNSPAKFGERLVLIVLAEYADKDGKMAFPSVQSISHKTNLCEREVRYCLSRLRKSGSIKAVGRRGERMDRQTTVYDICGVHSDAPRSIHGVQDTTSTGCKIRQNGVHSSAPNPPLYPPYNSQGRKNAPRFSISERIGMERELERIEKELVTLRDSDFPKYVDRRKILKARRAELRANMGVVA